MDASRRMIDRAMKYFKVLDIDIKKERIFQAGKNNKGDTVFKSKMTIFDFLAKNHKKTTYENVFIALNKFPIQWFPYEKKKKDGSKTIIMYPIEKRGEYSVEALRCFMFDIDVKFSKDGKEYHYHDHDKEIKPLKMEILKAIKSKIPFAIRPCIVETRNGYQLQFPLSENEFPLSADTEKSVVSKALWKQMELQILDWLKKNVSENVDEAVKDISRIERLIYSVHNKPDNDKPFQIKLIYATDKRYSIMDLQQAGLFDVNNDIIEKAEKQVAVTEIVQKAERVPTCVDGIVYSNEAIEAIKKLDAEYFVDRFGNFNINNVSTENFWNIVSTQIPLYLLLGVSEKKAFSSPFRVDNHPSCSIYQANNGKWICKDFATSSTMDTYDMVREISGGDNSSVAKFFYSLLGVEYRGGSHFRTSAECEQAMRKMTNSICNRMCRVVERKEKGYRVARYIFLVYEALISKMANYIIEHDVKCQPEKIEFYFGEKSCGLHHEKISVALRAMVHLGLLQRTEVKMERGWEYVSPFDICYHYSLVDVNYKTMCRKFAKYRTFKDVAREAKIKY